MHVFHIQLELLFAKSEVPPPPSPHWILMPGADQFQKGAHYIPKKFVIIQFQITKQKLLQKLPIHFFSTLHTRRHNPLHRPPEILARHPRIRHDHYDIMLRFLDLHLRWDTVASWKDVITRRFGLKWRTQADFWHFFFAQLAVERPQILEWDSTALYVVVFDILRWSFATRFLHLSTHFKLIFSFLLGFMWLCENTMWYLYLKTRITSYFLFDTISNNILYGEIPGKMIYINTVNHCEICIPKIDQEITRKFHLFNFWSLELICLLNIN